MTRNLRRLGLAGWAISIALAVVLPLAWTRLFPRHTGDELYVVLSPPKPEDDLRVPPGAIRAQVKSRGSIDERTEVSAAFVLYTDWADFAVPVPHEGRYTVYGVSSSASADPIRLAVNDVPVSSVAFYQNTGSRHDNFEVHRIASGVRLRGGNNSFRLEGTSYWLNSNVEREPFDYGRTLSIVLEREIRPGPIGWFGLAVAALLLITGIRLATLDWTLSPRAKLVTVCVATPAILFSLVVVTYVRFQQTLVPLGYKNPKLVERVQVLRQHLESEEHDRARREKYSVAIFGDSTHYSDLAENDHMLPSLTRAMPDQDREAIELYGLAAGGMYVWDYYLVLNWIADERPDLVVIPVNTNTFDTAWYSNEGFHFHMLDRHLKWSQFARTSGLSFGGRSFDWGGLVLQKIDRSLADGRLGWFLRGARVYYEREQERIEDTLSLSWPIRQREVPADVATTAIERVSMWNAQKRGTNIEDDKDQILRLFHMINRLAAEHDIEILYYTVLELQKKDGGHRDTPAEELPAALAQIADGPHVHTLDRPGVYAARLFSDRWIHLTPEGMSQVAADLAVEILEIKKGTDSARRSDGRGVVDRR